METNALPRYDMSDNPTNCCPRFKPEGWDQQELHFRDKLFVRTKTHSLFHVPLDMGKKFSQTSDAIEQADAYNKDDMIILSRDTSAWIGEHYFSVSKDVPGQEMVRMNGDYLTRVFEGPYKDAPKWERELESSVKSKGKKFKRAYYFYTTCPKCAKYYGKNYVVGVAEIA